MINTIELNEHKKCIEKELKKLNANLLQKETMTKRISFIQNDVLTLIYKLLWKYKKGNNKETIQLIPNIDPEMQDRKIEISSIGIGNNSWYEVHNHPYTDFYNTKHAYYTSTGFIDDVIYDNKVFTALNNMLTPEGQLILNTFKKNN